MTREDDRHFVDSDTVCDGGDVRGRKAGLATCRFSGRGKKMREYLRQIKLALLFAVIGLFIVSSHVARAQTRVTCAYSSIGSIATGVWMAKESGAFEKNGIQGDLIFISSGPVVVQALIGGDLQGGSGATNAVINAILNGAPIIGVAAAADRRHRRPHVPAEIKRLQDLVGIALAVARCRAVDH